MLIGLLNFQKLKKKTRHSYHSKRKRINTLCFSGLWSAGSSKAQGLRRGVYRWECSQALQQKKVGQILEKNKMASYLVDLVKIRIKTDLNNGEKVDHVKCSREP